MVIGNDPDRIIRAAIEILEKGLPPKKIPKLWDGKAAYRIVNILNDRL
jgi:UDP-N-acetylglucosamine 2-epimerase (non-hydrolysing)